MRGAAQVAPPVAALKTPIVNIPSCFHPLPLLALYATPVCQRLSTILQPPVAHQFALINPPACRQLAALGDEAAALGRRLAANDMLPADILPSLGLILLALGRLALGVQLSLQKVEEPQASGQRMSREQLAGLLAWPAAACRGGLQHATSAAPAALSKHALQVQLTIVWTVFAVVSHMLCTYGRVLDPLLPLAESGRREQLQGSLALATQ